MGYDRINLWEVVLQKFFWYVLASDDGTGIILGTAVHAWRLSMPDPGGGVNGKMRYHKSTTICLRDGRL